MKYLEYLCNIISKIVKFIIIIILFIYGFITTYIKLLIKKENYIKEDKYKQLLIKHNQLLQSITIKELDDKSYIQRIQKLENKLIKETMVKYRHKGDDDIHHHLVSILFCNELSRLPTGYYIFEGNSDNTPFKIDIVVNK